MTSAIVRPKDFSPPSARTGISSFPAATNARLSIASWSNAANLRKARMHGARTRVQLSVMPPSRLAETARSGGELVPKPVEVNPFASCDEPLHIRTAEAEMPEQRVLENVLPRANTRQRR